MDVKADGETLTLEDVGAVARDHAKAVVPRDARSRVSQSRRTLEGILRDGGTVYGVNTGFGVLADTPVSEDEGLELQRRIVLSHAAGVGDPLPPEAVRAAMLLSINTFSKGHSAVRTKLVDQLLRMLNGGVTPVVRPIGSLGASGDLSPLADIAMVITGKGEALDGDGQVITGAQALDFRAPKRPAGPVAAVYNLVRRVVPFYGDDRPLGDDVARMTELVRLGEVVRVVERAAREPLGW